MTSTPAAVINGTLALGGSLTITVDDALRIGSGEDLVINAVVSGERQTSPRTVTAPWS